MGLTIQHLHDGRIPNPIYREDFAREQASHRATYERGHEYLRRRFELDLELARRRYELEQGSLRRHYELIREFDDRYYGLRKEFGFSRESRLDENCDSGAGLRSDHRRRGVGPGSARVMGGRRLDGDSAVV